MSTRGSDHKEGAPSRYRDLKSWASTVSASFAASRQRSKDRSESSVGEPSSRQSSSSYNPDVIVEESSEDLSKQNGAKQDASPTPKSESSSTKKSLRTSFSFRKPSSNKMIASPSGSQASVTSDNEYEDIEDVTSPPSTPRLTPKGESMPVPICPTEVAEVEVSSSPKGYTRRPSRFMMGQRNEDPNPERRNSRFHRRLSTFKSSILSSVGARVDLNFHREPQRGLTSSSSPEAPVDSKDPSKSAARLFIERLFAEEDGLNDDEFLDILDQKPAEERRVIQREILRRLRHNKALLSLTKSINAELDHETAMKRIVNEACDFMRADRACLFSIDEKRGEIASKVLSVRNNQDEIRFPMGRGVAGSVASTGQSVNIQDAHQDARFNPTFDRLTGYRTRSILCMCIRDIQGKKIAVMQVINKMIGDGLFYEDDEHDMELFAVQAANCLRNAQLYEAAIKAQQKIAVLLDVARQMSSNLDLNSLCQLIMMKSRDLLEADRCTLYLIDKETNELWSKFADRQGEIRIPMGMGISGYVAQSGETLNIRDAYQDPRFNPDFDKKTGYKTKSILCMPIRNADDEIIGVTQMINKVDGGCFEETDEQLLHAFSSQASVSLMNSQLFERTKEMQMFLESILVSITNLVIVLNNEGYMLKVNHSTLPFLGISEEVMKKNHYEEWLGSKNSTFSEHIREVYTTSKSVYFPDHEFHMPPDADGEAKTKHINFSVVPLLASTSTQKGVVIVIEDVTPQKRLHSTLGRYMSPALADEIMKKDSKLQLGGKHLKVTTIFCDIRKFTSISEKMDAGEVVDLLNEYFSHMVSAVFAERGILDKYIGDALMAVFGVPMTEEDDSYRACRAAIMMLDNLSVFNQTRAKQGQEPIHVGIGINTGRVLSGNIGTERRLEYTVIGDGVNIASRIEGVTKQYGVTVMVSENTYNEVGHMFVMRELDLIRVVGKKKPIRVYELIREKTSPAGADNIDLAIELFGRGLEAYRNMEFTAAAAIFEEANQARTGGDPPSQIFAQRCRMIETDPPTADWDRVWNLDSK
eukprot:TRINITY_DN4145_c0_g1_i1.p1 TRINITY_DN4145_c0_g1~~TRINITY_DN4145_c0_g1_i1.p1  ORF type:complete len:1039 (+),score=218.80 TRINITY_DN4145_c0_g1_i1:60-3176(+)